MIRFKKIAILGLLIFQISLVNSQTNSGDIGFEIRYPLPSGDNFIHKGNGDGYSGLIDIGVDYSAIKINNLGFGILLNSSFLRYSPSDLILTILSPKIKIDYTIDLNKISIVPQIGFGYSNYRYRAPAVSTFDQNGDRVQSEGYKDKQNGLTFKAGTKLIINNSSNVNWYFQIVYEFTKLEKPELANDSKFNRNISMIYPGVGLIWKFKK